MNDATLLLWIERGKIVAGFLVAIGVAGEFLGDFLASPIIKRRDNAQQAEIARLNKEAGDARKAAADASERSSTTARHAEELRQQNLEISRRLEAERLKTLQLQRSVVHRMIPQIGEGDKRNWDSLKPFKGVQVLFLYSPQREPEMFASNLAPFPMNAGWDVLGIKPAAKNEIPDGVTVEAYLGPHGETDLSTEAAESLVEFLKNNGIEARISAAKKGELAPNRVVVRIGQIPDPTRALE